MDSIVNPFKQASIGIVKGVSAFPGNVVKGVTKIGDGLTSVSDSVVENAGKIFRTNLNLNNNNNNRINMHVTKDIHAFPIVEEPQAEVRESIFWKKIDMTNSIIECKKYSTSCFISYYG
jgi:hypothetical protein